MPTPLRLLFVATLPEPGGAASHLISLAKALAAAGHVVGVVTAPSCVIWDALHGVRGISLFAGRFATAFDPAAMRAVTDAIRGINAQRVFATFEQDYWGVIRAARGARVPVSLFLHHAGMRRTNRLLLPLARSQWLVPSQDLQQWLVALRVAKHRTSVLCNPIDTEYFRPDTEMRVSNRTALGFAPDDIVVGFVGRLESNKGVEPFAEAVTSAMQQVPTLRAMWIGFGRRESAVDGIINASPFAHRHVRLPWTADVLPHYSAMDLLALPSTKRESFGRVLVEAQSCGIPVLGSAIGGIPETMHAGESGELVPPGDVGAWSKALVSLCSDAPRRALMGGKGRAFVRERFDSAMIVKHLEALMGAPD